MPQQINSDDFENTNSEIDTQDTKSTYKYTIPKRNPRKILQSEVEKKPSFFDKWKTSRFWLVRGIYYVIYSVWMTVVVIAGFLAWLISLLFI